MQPPLPPWLALVDWYAHWLGASFADTYQNLYLRAETPSGEPEDAKLLFPGRNYQLFYRRDDALREFRSLLADYPRSQYPDDALLFRALLFRDLDGNIRRAGRSLMRLEARFPGSEWRGFADRLLRELARGSGPFASGDCQKENDATSASPATGAPSAGRARPPTSEVSRLQAAESPRGA